MQVLNHIILQGRFTRDPELRRTASGTAVCSFSLAVERDTKNQDGTRPVDFIDHVAWRGTAEMICKYFRKGSAAITEGRLELRDWTDDAGNRRRNAEVRVANIHFAESKKKEDAAQGGDPDWNAMRRDMEQRAADYGGGSGFAEIGEEDGELPF